MVELFYITMIVPSLDRTKKMILRAGTGHNYALAQGDNAPEQASVRDIIS
jgi:hypothetical protein